MAPPITRETARDMQRKSAESRERTRQAERQTAELFAKALAVIQAQPSALGDFRAIRLARVRAHLDRMDDMFCKEIDPQRLSQLAQAMDKVSEQERLLAGRPAPKAEESKRHQVRQGAKNSEQAAADRAEPIP